MALQYLLELALFAGKCALFVVAAGLLCSLVFALARRDGRRPKEQNQPYLVIKDLTQELKRQRRVMRRAVEKADPDLQLKKEAEEQASKGLFSCFKRRKSKAKLQSEPESAAASAADAAADKAETAEGKAQERRPKTKLERRQQKREAKVGKLQELEAQGVFCPRHIFVLSFNGSPSGAEVKRLRREIDAVLTAAKEGDEVVVKLTSPGGMVNSYGLLSSQLLRIRERGIYLTVCVDSVAASGGYLMACTANKIVAAPFAYIGSIGVVAEFPNFNRLLNAHQVDYEQVTAGKYKRTLTMLGENTPEAREKFRQELEAIHKRFIEQVLTYRPQLDPEKVATGEAWLALDAKDLGLVDEIAPSEEYLRQRAEQCWGSVLAVRLVKPKRRGLKALLSRMSLAQVLNFKQEAEALAVRLKDSSPYEQIR